VSRPRVLVVVGTRPEVIKLAPVIQRLRATGVLDVQVCATGQHRELLDQALAHFDLSPDHDLALMTRDQSLAELTARALVALDELLARVAPALTFVQGDTSTAFAAALASYYRRVPVAHVEAGLRTGNKHSPYPEEINRRFIAPVADLHFAPTESARSNLLSESIPEHSVRVTGNTAIDALFYTLQRERGRPLAFRTLDGHTVDDAALAGNRLLLVTAHRRENHERGLANICAALAQIAERHADVRIVFSLHFNPNVRRAVLPLLSARPNVHLVDPLNYQTFCRLMERAYLILTDSGGIQEEAPSLGKPVLVLRDTTERPEGIAAGNARLLGTATETVVAHVDELWTDRAAYARMAEARNPYGDGRAAERIEAITHEFLGIPASATVAGGET